MSVDQLKPSGRRADLDWLRIVAILLLIVTHTVVIYRSFEWRVHSSHAGQWGDLLGGSLGPWRMCLVFLIGGAAARFVIAKRSISEFARDRALRLLVPFVLAVLVFVPLEKLALLDYSDGPGIVLEALRYHFAIPSHIVFGVPLPDFGHAWFLPYLFVYGLIAAVLWRFANCAFLGIERRLGRMPVALIVATLAAAFFLADGALAHIFGMTGALFNDPAGHMRFLPPFLLGLFLVKSDGFWVRLQAARHGLALVAAPLLALSLFTLTRLTAATDAGADRAILDYTFAETLFGAVAIFTVLAFASRWLRRTDAPARAASPAYSYLGDAIMPVYLMHQLVIMLVADALIPLGLPLWAEFGAIAGSALLIPLGVYHLAIRPFGPTRFLFGLKSLPAAAPRPAVLPDALPAAAG